MGDAIEDTRRWVEDFVVRHELCPFAAGPLKAGAVRFVVCEAAAPGLILDALLAELERLDPAASPATTLLVLPQGPADFEDFLDLLAAGEALLEDCGYAGRLQLAAFHPAWVFAEADPEDPANAVNRAPHPTLHVLRWEDVRRAVDHHPDTAAIPTRNAALLRSLAR